MQTKLVSFGPSDHLDKEHPKQIQSNYSDSIDLWQAEDPPQSDSQDSLEKKLPLTSLEVPDYVGAVKQAHNGC